MNIQAINTYNAVQAVTSGKATRCKDGSGTKRQAHDVADISDEAKLLSKFLNGAGEDGVVTLDEIKAAAIHYRREAQKRLDSIMDELGIDKGVSFSLSKNMQGKVVVKGDFDGKEKFEEALNNDSEFSHSFSAFGAAASLYATAKEHEEFMRAYEADPIAAVEKYRQNLNGNVSYSVEMSYAAGVYDSAVTQKINGYSFA